jgi:hypothetical protein
MEEFMLLFAEFEINKSGYLLPNDGPPDHD